MKKTDNVKANVMQNIKDIFPEHINPFIAGLGNRENDAIAYMHAGISAEQIYIIDTDSEVHKLNNVDHQLTYKELVRDINEHFPKYHSPLIGYKMNSFGYETLTSPSKTAGLFYEKNGKHTV